MQGVLPFHAVEPEIARREIQTLVVIDGRRRLPPDTYVFVEHYCAVQRCDCRRTVLKVHAATTRKHLATLHHFFDPPASAGRPQTTLAQGQLQTEHVADERVEDGGGVLDARYKSVLEQHYKAFKSALNDPAHPIQRALPREERVVRAPLQTAPRVNRNDPCPCGSGKKFKKCHGAVG